MSYQEHRKQAPRSVSCAVITISDSRSQADDESGRLIQEKFSQRGHRVVFYTLLKNDAAAIQATFSELLGNDEVQVILTSGGTGASRRDITIETVYPMLEKHLDGFGELFRSLSYQEIGTASILSRAIAGVIRGKIILCLPGSLGAATLAMDKIILPEIGHMVREASR